MKYRITDETMEYAGRTLHRIECVEAFADVKQVEKGGWIEKEENLSQEGDCWVYGNARVYGNAEISDNARVYGNAWVSGDARVSGNARVYGNAEIATMRIRTTEQAEEYQRVIAELQQKWDKNNENE